MSNKQLSRMFYFLWTILFLTTSSCTERDGHTQGDSEENPPSDLSSCSDSSFTGDQSAYGDPPMMNIDECVDIYHIIGVEITPHSIANSACENTCVPIATVDQNSTPTGVTLNFYPDGSSCFEYISLTQSLVSLNEISWEGLSLCFSMGTDTSCANPAFYNRDSIVIVDNSRELLFLAATGMCVMSDWYNWSYASTGSDPTVIATNGDEYQECMEPCIGYKFRRTNFTIDDAVFSLPVNYLYSLDDNGDKYLILNGTNHSGDNSIYWDWEPTCPLYEKFFHYGFIIVKNTIVNRRR